MINLSVIIDISLNIAGSAQSQSLSLILLVCMLHPGGPWNLRKSNEQPPLPRCCLSACVLLSVFISQLSVPGPPPGPTTRGPTPPHEIAITPGEGWVDVLPSDNWRQAQGCPGLGVRQAQISAPGEPLPFPSGLCGKTSRGPGQKSGDGYRESLKELLDLMSRFPLLPGPQPYPHRGC